MIGGYAGAEICCSGLPIWGYDGNYQGVEGDSNTNSYLAPAVLGMEYGATEGTVGVFGEVASPSGAGVYGQNQATQSTTGSQSVYGAGVWGDAGTSGFTGVLGTADTGSAGYFVGGGNVTLYAVDTVSGAFPFIASGTSGFCSFDSAGNISCTGSKNAIVPIDGGRRTVALSAIESPKNWFEDFGSEKLSNGIAVIVLEPQFAQTVNTEQNYHVYLTPNGDCKGLYISQKTPTSFEVRELGGGTSNIAFDYRIVALRKNFENIRLADHTHDLDAVKEMQSRRGETHAPFDLNKLLPKKSARANRSISQVNPKK